MEELRRESIGATGERRKELLAAIGDLVYDEVWIIGLFDMTAHFGNVETLDWELRGTDDRLRTSTMDESSRSFPGNATRTCDGGRSVNRPPSLTPLSRRTCRPGPAFLKGLRFQKPRPH